MSASKKKLAKADVKKEVLRILAKARRETRFKSQRERDALIDAIRLGHSDIAHSLLDNGVDPNSTEPGGRSALWHAAHWGRSALIQDLVRRGARLPDDVLMGPVHDGDVETVRLLVRRGANVNCVATFTRHSYRFPQKELLLTVAIQVISALETAERIARKMRSAKTPRWRAAHPPGPPNGDLEAIPLMLIKAGANVNRLAFEYSLYEGFIRTTLGLAAHCGHARTVKAMLAAGADVNQRDTWGGTALFDAAREGQRQVVKILLAAGANADMKRRDGATPVSIARERGFTDLAEEIGKQTKGG
jgi:ankyrin repeat protein